MSYLTSHGSFAAAHRPVDLTIVIPTLNEAKNVPVLVDRLTAALDGLEWEAIFVDDGSSDGTAEIITNLANSVRNIRVIRRIGRRGLSSAVMEGFLSSTAPVLAVIDADLQHDERLLPDLYHAIVGGNDIAVGTRYADGGSTGSWSMRRRTLSRIATRLAGSVGRLQVSDPMSGFFAIRAGCFHRLAPRVSGVGYKILLDILASSDEPLNIAERPYTFRIRESGESKLTGTIALQYLELLVQKRVGKWVPIEFLKFACVGTMGLLIHMLILGLAISVNFNFDIGQACAVLTAMTFNFFINNIFTYRDRRLQGRNLIIGLLSFYLICGLGAVANVGVGSIVFLGDRSWWVAGLSGAIIGSVWNYSMGSIVTWRRAV